MNLENDTGMLARLGHSADFCRSMFYLQFLGERQSLNVLQFLEAING